MYKIGITGHRRLSDVETVRVEINKALVKTKAAHGAVTAISAMAVGADTVFAEEAIKLDIPLKILLPFAIGEYAKDFSKPALAILLDFTSTYGYNIETEKIPQNPKERKDAYIAVGKTIVIASDVLIAVWDGKPAKGKGGTGDVVAWARENGRDVLIVAV